MRGRDEAFGVLDEYLRSAKDGRGGVALIEGPAGIGKSRLLSEAVAMASDRGVAAAIAGPIELDQLMPQALLFRVAHQPVPSPPRGVVDIGLWRLEQLRSGLEERTAGSSLLLALDDLQWADVATLLAIQKLATEVASYPVLWLLAGRPGQPGSPLHRLFAALTDSLKAERIQLVRLTGEAVAAVIADVLGVRPDAKILSLAEGASGNPLLVIELVEGLRDVGAIALRGSRARLAKAQPPQELETIVGRRIGRLSDEAADVLDVAAVLGRSFSAGDVADAMGEPQADVLPLLQEAARSGVVVPSSDADAFVFRHETIREVVYEQISPAVRLALHRRIGAVLLDRGGSAGPAAGHLIRGARRGDHQALAGLDQAIHELLVSSPQSAAELALRGLQLTRPADEARFARTATAVEALVAARRFGEATDLARSILSRQGLPAALAAQVRLTLASILFWKGQSGEAVAEAEAVRAQPGLPDQLRSGAEAIRLQGLIAQDDWLAARETAETMLVGDPRSKGDPALVEALSTLGLIAWDEGRLADALGMMRAAVTRSDLGPAETRHLFPRLPLAAMLTALGEFDEAGAVIAATAREMKGSGHLAWVAMPALRRASLDLSAGRLDDAEAEATVALATAEELGLSLLGPVAQSVLASIALLRGDLQDGRRRIERVRAAQPTNMGMWGSAAYIWIEARIAEGEQGRTRTIDDFSRIYDDLPAHKRLLVEEPGAAAWMVRAALAAGNLKAADTVVACAELLAADNPELASVVASAIHARGLLNEDATMLEQAAVGHRHPWAQSSAFEDAGVMIGAGGGRNEANALLERALAGYEAAGADRDAARVRDRLRHAGVLHSRPEPRALSGWASLTGTERGVAEHVAAGMVSSLIADRMFLSRRVVDFYLRRIFGKLGVGSRAELTRSVREGSDGTETG